MSFLTRIKDLVSSNVNDMLDGAEDPEKMAEEYLRQLREEYYEAKSSVASAMADERRLEQKLAYYEADLEKWQTNAENALRAGKEDLARAALQKKTQAQSMVDQYRAQHTRQSEQVDELQEALVQLETRIAETQSRKEVIVAKKNRARTQETLQQTMRGVNQAGALDKLTALEEKVDDRLAKAEAMADLESSTLESQFVELEKESAVDSELEELKRKLGMSA